MEVHGATALDTDSPNVSDQSRSLIQVYAELLSTRIPTTIYSHLIVRSATLSVQHHIRCGAHRALCLGACLIRPTLWYPRNHFDDIRPSIPKPTPPSTETPFQSSNKTTTSGYYNTATLQLSRLVFAGQESHAKLIPAILPLRRLNPQGRATLPGDEFPTAALFDPPFWPSAHDRTAPPTLVICGPEKLHTKGILGHSAAFVGRRYVNDASAAAQRSEALLIIPSRIHVLHPTSSRPAGDLGGSFATRRGHSSQLSISDPSHHVTEAIGTLYGDEDDSGSEGGRPLSFVGGPAYQEQIYRQPLRQEPPERDPRRQLLRSQSDQTPGPATSSVEHGSFKKSQTLPVRSSSQRAANSFESNPKSPGGPLSPTPSLRDFQTADSSQFPLTNIDNPSDIAQELSNLQALRRLSMDVGSMNDPDMPPMTLSTIPAIAPSGDDDENDPSRLLWVPARVHPELAPTEFQTFLEKRVQSIRRRSGESMLSVEGDIQRNDSGSSLSPGSIRRQKSKLSRQIDNSGGRGAMGYVDGAERLERKRSEGHGHSRELSLDDLVKDPTKAVQKLAQESQEQAITGEGSTEDRPILPMAPGMGLRRSTRTTYRKGGSLRSGERPFSRRSANRAPESESSDAASPAMPEAPPGHGLSRVQSEPLALADNFSRPNRSVRRQNKFSQEPLPTVNISQDELNQHQDSFESPQPSAYQEELPVRSSSSASGFTAPQSTESHSQEATYGDQYGEQYAHNQTDQSHYPQRSSSQGTNSHAEQYADPTMDEPPPRSNRRAVASSPSNQHSQTQPTQQNHYPSRASSSSQSQNLSDSLAAHPGAAASRTDSLTFIPTLNQEERRSDRKSKKDDDAGSVTSTKSSGSGWKWFKSGTEDKKKEDPKKSKTKNLVEKAQDNVRLDVIQNSIDKTSTKSRESLVLDRDNVDSKLQEERKKDGSRKSDSKKEKDGSIFSSFFGGSKRKEEKEKTSKKSRHLEVPEEPVYKPLQPDVDYHWTRFPLLEERAIYRMAHIKLANPRRSLLSQVLLSNFMYSYLAIVQAMHPQMNVPTSPQQKRLEEEARRKQREEEYLAQQQMQDDQDSSALDQYDYDYHRAAVQYADSGSGQVDYVDEAQIYEDEHGRDQHNEYGYDGSDGYGQGSKEYYQYHGNGDDRRHERGDDMW
ncbi:activator of mitotic machinery cdc14 phosphatase activation c-term domain-containing protein [Sarocladium implicatum]|nr:activator of mitotic machinery cdc14 phosphatase activation c-term domain-containing protein [Sarocladium implicatum]